MKFISTRWLCLELCINRELRKYIGLKSYFLSEQFADNRFRRLRSAYEDPMTEVYLLFYQAILPVFTTFNKLLQREEPLIYRLHEAQQRFMHKLASKFIKPAVIHELKSRHECFSSLDISLGNQKDDIDLGIGSLTRSTMKHLLDDGDINQIQVDMFFDGVRTFYGRAYDYCVQWLPLHLLKSCAFVDFGKRLEVDFSHGEQTIASFSRISKVISENPSLINVEKKGGCYGIL